MELHRVDVANALAIEIPNCSQMPPIHIFHRLLTTTDLDQIRFTIYSSIPPASRTLPMPHLTQLHLALQYVAVLCLTSLYGAWRYITLPYLVLRCFTLH